MNTHLVFEPEKKNVTFYATPFGQMEWELQQQRLLFRKKKKI